jgi:hypothetical protein
MEIPRENLEEILMTGSFPLLAATLEGALVMGFLPAIWARLRLVQSEAADAPATAVDRLEKATLFLYIALMLAAGWAVDTWGPHDVLFVGSLLSALAIAGLGARMRYESLRWLVIMVAAASACLTVATTVAMPYAFLGKDDPAASLNLGFIAVGLGYLVLPLLADALSRRLGFRAGMLLLAFLSLLPAVFVAFTSKEELPVPPRNVEAATALSNPHIWLAALAAIFYFPLQGSVSSWMGDYLTSLGHESRRFGYWQAGFWTMFLASRFVTGQFLVPGYELWFVLVVVAVSAVTLGNLAGAYGPTSARGLLVLAGCLGPVVPSLLGALIGIVPSNPGVAMATVYACGIAGSLVLMPALKTSLQGRSVQVGMRIPLAATLLMTIPVLVLALVR